MSSLSPILAFVLLTHLCAINAVQLSDIFNLGSYEYFPSDFRAIGDGTAVLLGTSTFSVVELGLQDSSFVKVPDVSTDTFGTTEVLARFYPDNGTVIWAAAAVDFENVPDIAVDPLGNTYLAGKTGTPRNSFKVIKYGPRGNIIWKRDSTDPSFLGTITDRLSNDTGLEDSGSRSVEFTRGRLVLSGARRVLHNRSEFVALVIRSRDGVLVGVRPLPVPTEDSQLEKRRRVEKEAFVASGGVACFAGLQFLPNPKARRDNYQRRLFVQCRRLAGGKTVTRTLMRSERRLIRVEMDMIAGKDGQPPQVWTVFSSMRDRAKRHEIKVHRMDAITLDDVDWKTGMSTGSRGGGLKINFATPGRLPLAGSATRVLFSRATNKLVVVYSVSSEIKIVVQKGGPIKIQGGTFSFTPSLTYMMFFDSSKRLTVKRIEDDPRRGEARDNFNFLRITSAALSADGGDVYLYGQLNRIRRGGSIVELESGPFHVHPVRIPGVAD